MDRAAAVRVAHSRSRRAPALRAGLNHQPASWQTICSKMLGGPVSPTPARPAMKINVTTKINSNTQKFSSVDELPPNIREMYERALATGSGKLISADPKITTRIVVNGHEVESTKELSDAEQKLCADVFQLLKGAGTITDPAATAPPPTPIALPETATPVYTGFLTKNQWKAILTAIVLAGMALLIALGRQAFLR